MEVCLPAWRSNGVNILRSSQIRRAPHGISHEAPRTMMKSDAEYIEVVGRMQTPVVHDRTGENYGHLSISVITKMDTSPFW